MKNAVAAGIPVIVIDSGGSKLTRNSAASCSWDRTNIEAGVMAGERIKALGITKAVCANHEVGKSSLDDRCAGFAKGLGVDVPVHERRDRPDRDEEPRRSPIMTAIPTPSSCSRSASTAPNRVAALDELGLAGKVKIGTFDLSPTILQATVDGKMEWGIDAQQYAMGYIPVVMFDLWKKYKIAPIADYPTGPGFVDQGRRRLP